MISIVLSYGSLILYILDSALMMKHFYDCNKTGTDYLSLYYGVLKGLLLIFLGFYYFGLSKRPVKLEVLYIVFAFLGDVLLMSYNFQIYIIGGFFFLLSHIVMIIYFAVDWRKTSIVYFLLILPGFLLHALFLYPYLMKLEPQALMFLAYSLVLQIAAASSIGCGYKYNWSNIHYCLPALGYFLFLVSDFFLLYKEITQVPTDFKYIIMGTYIVAQYLIVKGLASGQEFKKHE